MFFFFCDVIMMLYALCIFMYLFCVLTSDEIAALMEGFAPTITVQPFLQMIGISALESQDGFPLLD